MSDAGEQGEPFEVSELEKSSGSGWMLGAGALVVALIGVGCGLFGFVQSQRAQAMVEELRAEQAARPDPTADLRESLDRRYEELDGRLERAGTELARINQLDRQLRSLRDDSQRAFETVTRDVRTNRNAINEMTGRLSEIVETLDEVRRAAPRTTAPAPRAANDNNGEETPSDAAAEGGVHVIESGDTLSRIAGRYGISLSRLMEANPGVNPNRLQIGQRIVIPEE
ncbi:MAG: LysM peptidoglycan-binding domain-containing protein [Opitutales bacterium]|nr:LysM peptidoglycan-binding domain-containing protein [Opitutales bacterium]